MTTAVLFDATRARKTAPKSFGRGLMAYAPTYRVDRTAADDAWYSQELARKAAEDRAVDRLADERAAEWALCRGVFLG